MYAMWNNVNDSILLLLLREGCKMLWWVCLSVCWHNSKTSEQNFTNLLCTLRETVALSSALWNIIADRCHGSTADDAFIYFGLFYTFITPFSGKHVHMDTLLWTGTVPMWWPGLPSNIRFLGPIWAPPNSTSIGSAIFVQLICVTHRP